MATNRRSARVVVPVVLLAALVVGSAISRAEEVKGRWRFDVQLGSVVPGGKIESDADNVETIVNGDTRTYIDDPRNIGTKADSRGKGRIELHASYGLWAGRSSELVLDLGVGYYKAKIEGIEVSYMFDLTNASYYGAPGCETLLAQGANAGQLGNCTWFSASANNLHRNVAPGTSLARIQRPQDPRFWTTEGVDGGTIYGYPVSVDVLFRYRPTKRFNPYLGAGVGYLFVRFDESERWRQIEDQLEGSLVSDVIGAPRRQSDDDKILAEFTAVGVDQDGTFGNERVEVLQLGHRLQRPKIATPDTPFVEARAGVELQFARRWSWFADAKFFWARRDITITVDGKEKFGQPTPNFVVQQRLLPTPDNPTGSDNPSAFPTGGLPAYIIEGGLRQPAYNPNNPSAAPLGGTEGQPGQYYVNGGQLKYGGWVFTTGVRFTL